MTYQLVNIVERLMLSNGNFSLPGSEWGPAKKIRIWNLEILPGLDIYLV